MKWVSIFLLAALACNQQMYDAIYRAIILQTLQSKGTAKDFKLKNDTIENLRKLCNGQKSTYETGTHE